jgi:tRNA A-37 threonylcarbamoyl transferase component Bud32
MQPDIGSRLGRFKLLATLGAGGFATVYRAEDTELDRQVAIKLLHPHLSANLAFVRRFRAEARAIARLRHPHIVTIYEVGETAEGRSYLVMALLEGKLLSRLITEEAPLPLERAAALLTQLASALDYLHDQGLIHRDVKPANVVVHDNGDVTLMDLGIARSLDDQAHVTQAGELIGTPVYMAPEQISGGLIGPSVDMYALGILSYELFAGRPPFAGSPSEVMDQQRFQPPPPLSRFNPEVPLSVAHAVEHALAKDPSARPASALAFVGELVGNQPELGPTIASPSPRPSPAAFVRARPHARPLAAVVAVLAIAVFGTGVALVHGIPGRPAATPRDNHAAQGRLSVLPAPFQAVSVISEDSASAARVTDAELGLRTIVPQVAADYGVGFRGPLVIHLANDESTARRVLTAMGASGGVVDNFFGNKLASQTLTSAKGVESVVYLPYLPNDDLRGNLAFIIASYTLRSSGALDRADAYPYWFIRGFERHQQARFSQVNFTLRQTALLDAKAGAAPALTTLVSQADALTFASGAADGSTRLDARGQAAVDYIVQNHGEGAIARLLRENAFGSVAQFNGVLQSIVKTPLDEFNEAVTGSLR